MKHPSAQFQKNAHYGALFTTIFILIHFAGFAQNLSVGNCGGLTVHVCAEVKFTNNTGQTANDLHFRFYQNDNPDVFMQGAQVSGDGEFSGGSLTPTDNGVGDGHNHGVDVDLNGGSVPPGGSILLDLCLCLNEHNMLKIKDRRWTFNGNPIGKAGDNQGWRVGDAQHGGNGGNPTPNGGGQGGQGGGGGTGHYVHKFSIENDDTMDIHVLNLKLLASMSSFSDITSISWGSISAIADPQHPYPITVHPGDQYSYYLNTTGSYVGGHVYSTYQIASDTEITYGDHPVTAITTDPIDNNMFVTSNQLPPNGTYSSVTNAVTTFANGVKIRNVNHGGFTNFGAAPVLNATQSYSFNSQVSLEVSLDGGQTYLPAAAPASASISATHDWDNGNTKNFAAEMISLSMIGGTLPNGVRIRESPTLHSNGRTSINPDGAGYRINSFFDVFTELSLDGGQTWSAAQSSTQVQLGGSSNAIPTLSQWGLIILAILLTLTGVIMLSRRKFNMQKPVE